MDTPNRVLSISLAGCILVAVSAVVNSANLAYGSDPATISQLHDPIVTTIAGERLTELALGQQAVIGVTANNLRSTWENFVLVVDVRDGAGFTEYLAWQSGVIEPNGNIEMQFSWSPGKTCEFLPDCEKREIRSFAISSITEPSVLSVVSTTQGIIISGIPTEVPPLNQRYGVPLHDRMYNVTYTFHGGSGKIVDIGIDRDSRMLTVSVETLQDSRLMIAIQKPLFDYALMGNTQNAVELYVLVDGKDTPFRQLISFEKGFVTYIVNVEDGPSQVTMGGRVK